MAGFWPRAGWGPWDALVDAGYRVVDDPRAVAPPCVYFRVDRCEPEAGCHVVNYTVDAMCIGPDSQDSPKYLWTGMVPILLPFADPNIGAVAGEYEQTGLPSVSVSIPVPFVIGV